MTKVWCVRANFGSYTDQFVKNGYVAIGWLETHDLSQVATRDELYALYKAFYPDDKSPVVIGQQVGQIGRFLFDIHGSDIVITPDANTEFLQYGTVQAAPAYDYMPNDPLCPYPHRRKIEWAKTPLLRSSLSVPLQNTLRSSLTVFGISQIDEVLTAIGKTPKANSLPAYNAYSVVLKHILQLDDKEFEILVSHLLTAMGFEGSEVTGKSGDGGVDAIGELNLANLAKVRLFVQAKRYQVGTKISAPIVKALRASIPTGGQGAFITTADFQAKAFEIALQEGFPRIGLVNGHQLVDLLIANWDRIPSEFRERLSLKPGLVVA